MLPVFAFLALAQPQSAIGLEDISGTISIQDRLPIPRSARLHVTVERTRQGALTIIGEQVLHVEAKDVPLPFRVQYLAGCVRPGDRLRLSARILAGDSVLYRTKAPVLVAADGTTALTLEGVFEMSAPLRGTEWVLVRMQGQRVDSKHGIMMKFNPDEGSFSANTGTNQLSGGFSYSAPWMEINPGPMTMRAGTADAMDRERAFLQILTACNRVRISGSSLALLRGDKVLATFTARD